MKEGSSYIEIAYSAIPVFANDGTLDEGELNFLLGLALRDGEVDDDEKRVLRSIFDKVSHHRTSDRVRQRILEARQKHGI